MDCLISVKRVKEWDEGSESILIKREFVLISRGMISPFVLNRKTNKSVDYVRNACLKVVILISSTII